MDTRALCSYHAVSNSLSVDRRYRGRPSEWIFVVLDGEDIKTARYVAESQDSLRGAARPNKVLVHSCCPYPSGSVYSGADVSND